MCRSDQSSDNNSIPSTENLRTPDGSKSDVVTANTTTRHQTKKSSDKNMTKNNDTMISGETSLSWSVVTGVFHGFLWCTIGIYLPYLTSPRETARKVYQVAAFDYDPAKSLFDNTIWTWGTDYALAIITGIFSLWIIRTSSRSSRQEVQQLANMSASMLFLYSVSTGSGAIAHQFFLTVESRNTVAFRLLWIVCVGNVYLAAAPMGMIASQCLRIFQSRSNCSPLLKTMPYLRKSYWLAYGITGAFAFAKGFISYQRPAADIFIAGVTQTPCTFYIMAFLYLVELPGITNFKKTYGLIGFILNAYLFPAYTFLVDSMGWSMAMINTFLHVNLCISWSLQGLILQRLVKSLVEEETESEKSSEELRQKKDQ